MQCTCDYTFSNPLSFAKIKLESFLITLFHSLSLVLSQFHVISLSLHWQHVSLTLMPTSLLKAEQFFGAKLRRRPRRRCGTQGLEALSCGCSADFSPVLFAYLFSSFDRARENVFNLL